MNSRTLQTPDESTIAAYLANRLPEPAAQAFERYCLEDARFARLVERDLAFKVGLRQIFEKHGRRVERPVKLRRAMFFLAAAAAFALIAVGASWILPISASAPSLAVYRTLDEFPSGLKGAVVSRVSLMRLRGPASSSFSVTANGVVELSVLADLPSDRYTLSLRADRQPPEKAQIVTGLQPRGDYLTVYLPANQLIGKDWLIGIEPASTQVAAEHELFPVTFSAARTP